MIQETTFEQMCASRKRESGAEFWFEEKVDVYPIDPTAPIWHGTVDDVIRCSRYSTGFDGHMYIVVDNETGRERHCRQEQLCYPHRHLTPEKQAQVDAWARQNYPRYYR